MDKRTKFAPLATPVISGSKPAWFDWLFGAFLGLLLLKFGNPITMEKYMEWPANGFEWLLNAWPIAVGRIAIVTVVIAGVLNLNFTRSVPKRLLVLPVIWLGWEALAVTNSVSPDVSGQTFIHFACAVGCFYLGLFCLGRRSSGNAFFVFVILGFTGVVVSALEQHFGGLDSTRKYWMTYVYPTLQEIPPGFYKKMTSTRVFGTMFYPNALAGAILLLLPMTLGVLWSAKGMFTRGARMFLMGVYFTLALGALFWSGSKAGWLMFLMQGIVFVLMRPIHRKVKWAIVTCVLIVGLTGFAMKYKTFFEKGATSVVARFDYWQAAIATAKDKPLLGNGPGTFGKAYELRKRPESEMAQLAHNDYLQQASDSGVPGFLFFSVFVIWGVMRCARAIAPGTEGEWVRLGVWLGLIGWAAQSFVEFGLYIPAIGWVAFAFMGWLLGRGVKVT